jgi:hypothetical protein
MLALPSSRLFERKKRMMVVRKEKWKRTTKMVGNRKSRMMR